MRLREKYTKTSEKEANKPVISDDAYAIVEAIESLTIKLNNLIK